MFLVQGLTVYLLDFATMQEIQLNELIICRSNFIISSNEFAGVFILSVPICPNFRYHFMSSLEVTLNLGLKDLLGEVKYDELKAFIG